MDEKGNGEVRIWERRDQFDAMVKVGTSFMSKAICLSWLTPSPTRVNSICSCVESGRRGEGGGG